MNYAGLAVVEGIVGERCLSTENRTCLIFAVELVHILDELSVEEVKGNVLRTYSGAFAAVCTSSCYMVSTDDVEHILFECVCACLCIDVGIVVIEYAGLAGTSGTYVSTCVAADAA